VQHAFFEDLVLYIAKGYHLLSYVENPWLRHMVLRQCLHVVFPSQHQLVTNVLPNIVEKTREKCVLPSLASYITCTSSFDLWMSRGGHDIFTMVVSFINKFWEPTHVIMKFFEVHNTTCAIMAN
jgi:hypothetical protein